jgi:hypothetical protein
MASANWPNFTVRLGTSHFALETRRLEPHLAAPVAKTGRVFVECDLMEPGDGRGLGASGGAVAMALIVALVVLMMVNIGGGLTRPLIASPRVAAAQTAHGQG